MRVDPSWWALVAPIAAALAGVVTTVPRLLSVPDAQYVDVWSIVRAKGGLIRVLVTIDGSTGVTLAVLVMLLRPTLPAAWGPILAGNPWATWVALGLVAPFFSNRLAPRRLFAAPLSKSLGSSDLMVAADGAAGSDNLPVKIRTAIITALRESVWTVVEARSLARVRRLRARFRTMVVDRPADAMLLVDAVRDFYHLDGRVIPDSVAACMTRVQECASEADCADELFALAGELQSLKVLNPLESVVL